MMEDGEVEMIKLVSQEGHEFWVDKQAACVSTTIRNMLGGPHEFSESQTGVITLSEFPSNILEKVIQYFYYKRRYAETVNEIPDFTIEPEIALQLLMAASFLDA